MSGYKEYVQQVNVTKELLKCIEYQGRMSKEDEKMKQVRVKSEATSYGGRYNNRVIEVARDTNSSHGSVGCIVPGHKNNASSYGYFWFKRTELTDVTATGGLIDNDVMFEIGGPAYKTIGAVSCGRFGGSGKYRHEVMNISKRDDLEHVVGLYNDAVTKVKLADPAVATVVSKDNNFVLNLAGIDMLINDDTKVKLGELYEELQDAIADIDIRYDDLAAILELPEINTIAVLKEANILAVNETSLNVPQTRGYTTSLFKL